MTTTATPGKGHTVSQRSEPGDGRARTHPGGGGLLRQYKPEQGKATRTGSFVGAGLLIVWGGVFLNGRLSGYQGDEAWRFLITPGIPILAALVVCVVAWRVTFVNRKSSDFMIATEGEMKKVSWSSRREVIGSTKVVILFTVLMAVSLFFVDILFQKFFSFINVLKIAE